MLKNNQTKKQAIIQDISIYSSSTYIAQFAYFIRGFLNALIVGPAMYGLWNALGIIYDFAFCPHLGILNGMAREIPYSMGKGDERAVDKTRSSAFGFTMTASIIAAILVISVSFFFRKSLGLIGMIGVFTISALIPIQNAVTFYEMALSAIKKFSLVAMANTIFPIASAIATLILVKRWNIYGIYAVAFFIPLAIALFYYFTTRYRPSLKFDAKESLRLIKIGFPLMALVLLPVLFFTIDKMIILKFLGTTALGYYALALLICKAIIYLPAAIGMVLEPRLFHRYGETGDIQDLAKYLFIPTTAMSVLFPLLIAAVYFISSFVIRHLLTQYLASIGPLFIILFGKFFVLFSPILKGFFTAINRQKKMLFFYLLAMFLSAILDFAVLKAGYGLIAVASVSALVSFLLGSSLFIYAAGFYIEKWPMRIFSCVKVYLPYAYMLVITLGLDFYIKDSHVLLHDLTLVFFRITALIILSMPFIWFLEKKIRVMRDMLQLVGIRR